MKIVFEYMKNFFDDFSPLRKAEYYVFDLNSRVDRRLLHEMIDEYADELIDGDYDRIDDIEEEKERVHELIRSQDAKALYDELLEFFGFNLIENTLQEALINAGYIVEKSKASASLYVKVDGKEIRISDHKRPAYDSGGGIYEEHDYAGEIITEDNRVTKRQLEEVGINLDEEVYYLG